MLTALVSGIVGVSAAIAEQVAVPPDGYTLRANDVFRDEPERAGVSRHAFRGSTASHGSAAACAEERNEQGGRMLKIVGWIVAIIFIVGLLTLTGVFSLIF